MCELFGCCSWNHHTLLLLMQSCWLLGCLVSLYYSTPANQAALRLRAHLSADPLLKNSRMRPYRDGILGRWWNMLKMGSHACCGRESPIPCLLAVPTLRQSCAKAHCMHAWACSQGSRSFQHPVMRAQLIDKWWTDDHSYLGAANPYMVEPPVQSLPLTFFQGICIDWWSGQEVVVGGLNSWPESAQEAGLNKAASTL